MCTSTHGMFVFWGSNYENNSHRMRKLNLRFGYLGERKIIQVRKREREKRKREEKERRKGEKE